MKMVAGRGRGAKRTLSLLVAVALSALGPAAFAADSSDEEAAPGARAAAAEGSVLAPPAQGKPDATSAKAEIMVLYGSNDGTGIDPRIGKIPELSQPPLSSYNSYQQLDRDANVQLQKGNDVARTLPDSSKLTVTFKDLVKDKDTGESRYVLNMSIVRDTKAFLPSLEVKAKENNWFFVAGQRYKNGILVIGIRIL